jgi:DNA-binding transcriptional MerR regulator
MPIDHQYSLQQLADLADVTPRTIRYYVAQGLLASPAAAGPGTRYDESHLTRLRLIRRLQAEHLPLAEIRHRLATLSSEEIEALVSTPPAPAADSALDYLDHVLGGRGVRESSPVFALSAAPSPPQRLQIGSIDLTGATAAVADRSQWDRIQLDPDVELHVRRPLSRTQHKRVERLIELARQILEEDPT